MSYACASAKQIRGQLTTAVDVASNGVTVACWVECTVFPGAADYALCFSADTTNAYDFVGLYTYVGTDEYAAITSSSGGGGSSQARELVADGLYDTEWVGWVGTFDSDDTGRDVYIGTYAQTGTSSVLRATGDLSYVTIGSRNELGGDFESGNIAEVAVWDKVLTEAEITSYLAGTAASGIANSNLRAYYPLNVDRDTEGTILNDSSAQDAGGTLTILGATYAESHPTITSGTTDVNLHGAGRGILRGIGRGIG